MLGNTDAANQDRRRRWDQHRRCRWLPPPLAATTPPLPLSLGSEEVLQAVTNRRQLAEGRHR